MKRDEVGQIKGDLCSGVLLSCKVALITVIHALIWSVFVSSIEEA